MTEQEWLECNDPPRMWVFLPRIGNDRKKRLFACACCRRIWHLLPDERSRRAVETAERYVDGWATTQELDEATSAALGVQPEAEQDDDDVPHGPWLAAYNAGIPPEWWGGAPAFVAPDEAARSVVPDQQAERAAQCDLLRDIFGPLPFRPIIVEPAWITPTVKGLAEGIYIDRAFERMPILADALEESGCTNEDILIHCRQPATHVRGCWVVDLFFDYLDKAGPLWNEGKAAQAGRLLFENLPNDARPKWAGRILKLVLERSGVVLESLVGPSERSHLNRLLEIVDNGQWALGHRCFDSLRGVTLRFDDMRRRRGLSSGEDTFANVVLLAELVAKVTYNAADPTDPFDQDSGWFIASTLRHFVEQWKDEEFAKEAWAALTWEG